MDAIVVGIDVSKDRLDVCGASGRGDVSSSRATRTGLERADRTAARRWRPRVVAVEATGGFETVVAASLAAAGLPVVVVNPAQVRAFAQALGKRAKTDPIDAAVIAHFVEATKPETAAAAGRRDAVARRSRRPAAPDRRDDRRRAPARSSA